MLKDIMRYHSHKMSKKKKNKREKKIKIGEKWAKSFAGELGNEPKTGF